MDGPVSGQPQPTPQQIVTPSTNYLSVNIPRPPVQLNLRTRTFYLNVGGMGSKLSDFYPAVAECEYDIIVICETWLNHTHLDGEIAPPGWVLFRRDRPQPDPLPVKPKKGGGVLILAREQLRPVHVTVNDRNSETLWIKTKPGQYALFVGTAYVPSTAVATSNVVSEVAKVYHDVEREMNECDDAAFFCDLNKPNVEWFPDDELNNVFYPINATTESELVIVEELLTHNLYQLNNTPNSHGNILETVFLTRHDDVTIQCPAQPFCRCFGSDDFHHPVVVELSHSSPNRLKPVNPKPLVNRDFKRANYTAINNALESVNWNESLSGATVDEKVEQFYNIVNDIIDKNVPLTKRSSKHSRPWMTPKLIQLRTRRRNLVRRVSAFNNLSDIAALDATSQEFSALNKTEYDKYVQSTGEQLKQDPRKFWSFIDERRNRKDIPTSMQFGETQSSNTKESADLFANFFSTVFTEPTESVSPTDFEPNTTVPDPLNHAVTEIEVRKLVAS